MTSLEIDKIVHKLIGPIIPVGATHTDQERFENLEALIDLTDKLLGSIDHVACMAGSPEHSIKKAAERASKFYADLGVEQ